MTLLKRFLTLLLLPLILAAPPALAQEEDEDGGGFLERLIEDSLSGAGRDVRIVGFRGALSSEATLERMTISDSEGVWLELENATLNWRRTALLRGQLVVNELSAERLAISRAPITEGEAPAPEASGDFALPDLPVSVEVGALNIARVELGAPLMGEDIALEVQGSARLADGEGEADVSVNRLDGPQDSLTLAGSYANESGALTIDVSLEEESGGIVGSKLGLPGAPSLALTVQGDGVLDDFTADLQLATDGEERLGGQVTLQGSSEAGRQFTADFSGDLRPLLPEEHREFFGPEQSLQVSGLQGADGTLDLDTLDLQTAMVALTGSARIGADGWPELMQLDGKIASEDGSPVRLAMSGDVTMLDSATLTVDFDAAQGEAFTLDLVAEGIDRPDMSIERADIAGRGTIRRSAGASLPGGVEAQLTFDASGLDFADASMADAAGEELKGIMQIDWQAGDPLYLRQIDFGGAGLSLAGDVTFSGLGNSGNIVIEPDLAVKAEDIARFSGLAGRQLGGDADLAVKGTLEPVAGRFDVTAQGRTLDLRTGIPQADGLLEGEVDLFASAVRNEEGTELRRLDLSGDGLKAVAEAKLQTGGSTGTFDISIPDVSKVQDGLSGAVQVSGTLDETPEAYRLDIEGSAPGGTDLDGLLTASKLEDGGIGTIRFEGDAAAQDLAAFAPLAGKPLAGGLDLQTDVTYTLDGGAIDAVLDGTLNNVETGIAQVDGLLTGTVDLDASVAYDGDLAQIRQLTVNGQAVQVSAEGEVYTAALLGGAPTPGAGQSNASFDISLPDMSLIQPEITGPARFTGTLQEEGTAYLLDLDASAPGDVRITGKASAEKQADGSLGMVTFDGDVAASDLSIYAPLAGRPLAGGLNLTADVSYDMASGAADAVIDGTTRDLGTGIAQVDGLLTGTVDLDASVAYDGDLVQIRQLDVNGQAIQVTAQGDVYTAALLGKEPSAQSGLSDASFDIALPDMSLIQPGVTGGAQLRGTLQESDGAYQLDFTGSGPGEASAQGRLTAEKLGGGQLGMVGFDGSASVASLGAYAPLVGQPLSGGVNFDGTVGYNLADGSLSADGRLDTRALALGIPTVDQLVGGDGSAVVQVSRDASGALSIQQFEVQTREITATASGTYGTGDSSITYNVALRDLGLLVPQLPGRATAEGTLALNGSQYQVQSNLTAPGGTRAQVSGSIAQDFGSANLAITGNAPLELANEIASPNLMSGMANIDLRLNGPLAVESLSGNVTVNGARVIVPTAGLEFTGLNVNANVGGGQTRLTATTALATGGRINVDGTIGMSGSFPADLNIALNQLVLEDRRLYQVQLGGNVSISGPLLTGPTIGGEILIDNAEIRIPETGLGPGSHGFVLTHVSEPFGSRVTRIRAGLLDEEKSSGGSAYSLPLDLVIRAPQQIFVRGRGLDMELGGALRITGSSSDVITEGRFDLIRGRLDILGQRLTLDRASMALTGGFIPTLDIAATSQVESTTVTVSITGLATEPDVEFSSDPSRPEEEVLALLLFGRDITEISGFQALQIAAAVNTLAGRGSGAVDGLRQNLGLDDLDVTTNDEGEAGLRLGKYISEDIYTDVEVDSGGDSAVNLNIKITPSLKAKGSVTSEGDSTIGLYYEHDY
ncbi:translocation/assembly module TamB domain-containing protein [Alloyangia pacifica]|uniref:Autotransporter secretion inner membrane protein TamB n=1 Tax=Alloyangia pacifica TaxID=311180 RepID=A0A1I6TGF2_9RHOB|nr:translocation/assembly module TamB domain-containing protein [Alloyangia pacifica]SDH18982.1 autotransporter secretion inner membrane protein TamB [Alloyangia pacifica]SFS88261.1 autotransporter secretion inner membrane protein TamB [Alloyangia pacifica]